MDKPRYPGILYWLAKEKQAKGVHPPISTEITEKHYTVSLPRTISKRASRDSAASGRETSSDTLSPVA